MRASILKRLEALELAANQHLISRLRLVDVTELGEEDRDDYLAGNMDVMNRYAPPIPDLPPDVIHTVVISVHPASREAWAQALGMSNAELDAYDEERLAEEDRFDRLREHERLAAVPEGITEPAIQYDAFGYPIPADHANSTDSDPTGGVT